MATETKAFTNTDLAEIFERITSLLEIKGEVIYKIRAYSRAAESLRNLGEDANSMHQEGRLEEIPAVGKAIAEKIEEILTTGRLGFLEKLEDEVPPGLIELLNVPDVGPRKAALFWKQLGITDLGGLEQAARQGKLRDLPGMGEKSEARIISGIEALARRTDRMTLGIAWDNAERWLGWLRTQPGVSRAEAAGSLRRWRDTVGDLDLIAAVEDDSKLMENFTTHPEVAHVLSKGENKSSVELKNGLRIQIWAHRPEKFGSLWVHATGSKAHNVRLREIALKKKLSLSDQGFLKENGDLITYATEEEVYAALDLPWMPAELREDRGEIEAAQKGKLPRLIELDDLRAELHAHSNWSDGSATILEMAHAALARGFEVLAITDHTATLGITRGLTAERVAEQRKEIEKARKSLGDSLVLLHGIETDIMADGTLALTDEVLSGLDIVIASLHSSLRQPREAITRRLVRAIQNPHVDIIAHPSGRLLPNREGADLDWESVLEAAKETGVALEINASPQRLDLTDVYARRAIELGIPLAINTDAHAPNNLELARFGVSVARRAWAEKKAVLNSWTANDITDWLIKRD
jgi:DNA polymerase (family X)